ncbi:MAG: C1 family peptidase [candidate division Zixibacteria bacterium]|nr:C1 family peptidase [candidate division Zixibacteria bacterium]
MQTIQILRGILIWCFLILFSFSLAMAGKGGLSKSIIKNSREAYKSDVSSRASYNAVTNNNIRDLALNRDIVRNHNELFSHKIKTKGVVDQKSSGRCWAFAWLNTMRPMVIEKYDLDKFEFSQNYLVFWDKMEKANSFLEYIIEFRDRDLNDRELEMVLDSPFPDGGYWRYGVNLIQKYGLVPKDIMPETNSSENTRYMNRVISKKLRMDAAKIRIMSDDNKSVKELRKFKEEKLAEVYRLLAINIGEPPVEFEWRYEIDDTTLSEITTYTPNSFFEKFVDAELDDYVCLFNNPTRPYGEHYQSFMSRCFYDGDDLDHVNIKLDKIKEVAKNSIIDNQPLYFSCDVRKDQNSDLGIMAENLYDYGTLFGIDLDMPKKDMARYLHSSSNHGMSLIGVDVVDGEIIKWLVENSWGDDKKKDGRWTMYDNWFDNYVYYVIAKKKYVPKDILKLFDKEPIVIPPWDPVASFRR